MLRQVPFPQASRSHSFMSSGNNGQRETWPLAEEEVSGYLGVKGLVGFTVRPA